jgi:hypothetical protein
MMELEAGPSHTPPHPHTMIRTHVTYPDLVHSGDRLAVISWTLWASLTPAEGVAATINLYADAVILRADRGPGTERLTGLAPGGLGA